MIVELVPERPSMPLPEASIDNGEILGARFRDGDEAAFGRVVSEYHPRLAAFCRPIVKSHDTAEDAVQETFMSCWKHRHQLRDPARLEAWLFTVARHAALRLAKQSANRPDRPHDESDISEAPDQHPALSNAVVPPQAREAHGRERLALLLADALAALDPKRRDLLSLRFYSELPLADIAAVLDMPLGSVGTTLQRALVLLRKYFEERGFRREDLLP